MLPKTFKFSATITILSLLLSACMFKASLWQWDRYKYKSKLVATYKEETGALAKEFKTSPNSGSDFKHLLNKKVVLDGTYDFKHQMLVLNQKHASGPGYWLLTPFKISSSNLHVIVSRGFIPYQDRTPETWEKYNFTDYEKLLGVVQETVPHRTFLSPKNQEAGLDKPWVTQWLYPDLESIAKQLPYPIITSVFIQRLGGPANGIFPAESISIKVPPSTHFGYTIEWLILGVATLLLAFLLQAFPRRTKKPINIT